MKQYPCAPRGTFRGQNFMTPTVEGYFRGTFRGRVVWIELSSGTGLDRAPIFGVTFRRLGGGELWREGFDPSALFFSREAALAYIQGGPSTWESKADSDRS